MLRNRPSAEANVGSNAWVTGRPEFEREPRRHITAARVSANPRRHRSQPIVVPYASSVLALIWSARRFRKLVAAGHAPPDVDQINGQKVARSTSRIR